MENEDSTNLTQENIDSFLTYDQIPFTDYPLHISVKRQVTTACRQTIRTT